MRGEDNVWDDLLSRTGAAQAQVPTKSVRRLLAMVSPVQQTDFNWPSPAGIVVHVLFVRGVKSIDVGNFLSDGIHKYAEVRDRRLCPRRPSFPPGEQAVLDRRGTSKIVRVVTDYVTQQLVQPYDLSLHHACRFTMYYEGGNDVT
ncbi:hypothetical protein DYB25_007616 [Aphanomyces astaci]|uniref:Uncharacterized protein n=1 Tax=Aphanomyces astaci TaxID=112090 RepID=A0A397BIX7_APHAT|nr:hypothetical protein DYB36_007146 [Aphanomyces astaci]RHY20798.1 hypothetical protein DYB25_007616 [Aphanomyces astaci]RHY64672.1 hypothetical protein DYB34_006079 [Aphanomyces astaci]RHZ05811.1 hypothetical protein DYB31_012814 [Aphanomyces astaci]